MQYIVSAMTEPQARQIIRWRFDPPYQSYSFEDSEENLCELLEENYHAVCNEWGDLVGFFCFGRSAQVPQGRDYYNDNAVDIGLALAPWLCSQGLGSGFLQEGLRYCRQLYPGTAAVRLTVKSWNERAFRLYRSCGFSEIGRFCVRYEREYEYEDEEEITEFIVMIYRY